MRPCTAGAQRKTRAVVPPQAGQDGGSAFMDWDLSKEV
jgi:hypothetical protein